MANDPDAMAAESLENKNEANNKIDIVDDKKQGTGDMLQGILGKARDVDNVQGPVMRTEASRVDSALVIHIYSYSIINTAN